MVKYNPNMSDEEFKKAFDLDPTAKNKGDVKSFMKNVADQVEDYYKTFTTLKDKYGDKVLPELYKNNTPEEYFQAKAKIITKDLKSFRFKIIK